MTAPDRMTERRARQIGRVVLVAGIVAAITGCRDGVVDPGNPARAVPRPPAAEIGSGTEQTCIVIGGIKYCSDGPPQTALRAAPDTSAY